MPQTTFNTSVGSTATQILAPNARRIGFSLQNTGGVTVFIGFSSGVTTSSFVKRMRPNASFDINEHLGIWKGNIYGVTSASSTTISGSEWRE